MVRKAKGKRQKENGRKAFLLCPFAFFLLPFGLDRHCCSSLNRERVLLATAALEFFGLRSVAFHRGWNQPADTFATAQKAKGKRKKGFLPFAFCLFPFALNRFDRLISRRLSFLFY
jgi:hypothetical protein